MFRSKMTGNMAAKSASLNKMTGKMAVKSASYSTLTGKMAVTSASYSKTTGKMAAKSASYIRSKGIVAATSASVMLESGNVEKVLVFEGKARILRPSDAYARLRVGGLGRDKGRGKPSLWLRGLEDWRIGGLKGLVY